VKKVADQNTGGVAPAGVGGGSAAAQLGGVDNIIVEQGGCMDEFNNGGEGDVVTSSITAGFGRQQNQQWPQAFAAGIYKMLANIFNKADVRVQLLNNERDNGFKIVPDDIMK